jgi:uncharacterized membrane protein YgcG
MRNQERKRSVCAHAAFAVVASLALFAGAATAGVDAIKTLVQSSSLPAAEQREVIGKAEQAVDAGIAAQEVTAIVDRALRRGADGPALGSLLGSLINARAAGLPTGPVADRILQGLAKGVTPGRVAAAAQRLVDALAKGQRVVSTLSEGGKRPAGAAERDAAIEAAGRAIEQSVPEDTVLRTGFKTQRSTGGFTLFQRSLDTVLTFSAWGLPSGDAVRLVHLALDRGYGADDLAMMERDALERLKKGTGIDEVASEMETAISRSAGGRYRGLNNGDTRDSGPGARGGGGSLGGRMERRR